MSFRKPIDDEQKSRTRDLRHDATFPERLLWGRLRARRLAGIKVRRQHSIAPYIVDFFCEDAQVVIELDGNSHADRGRYDADRTAFLERQGLRVVRIANDDVLRDLDAVLEQIIRECCRK